MASSGEQQPNAADVDFEKREKQAAKKEGLVNLMSGAKEKLDTTIAGMKGAGYIMRHGFSKEAREEGTAKTIEEKNQVVEKQATVRMVAHQQLMQEKAIAKGASEPGADGANPANQAQTEEGQESASSSSSDSSAHARAQIPPDSEEYRSG